MYVCIQTIYVCMYIQVAASSCIRNHSETKFSVRMLQTYYKYICTLYYTYMYMIMYICICIPR